MWLEHGKLGAREAEEERGCLGVQRLSLFGGESALEVRGRLLVGMRSQCPLAGDLRVVDEPVDSEDRLGFGEVMSQLGRVGLDLGAVQRF